MTERIFDVVVTVTKMVRVRVPDDVLTKSREGHADVAEEFAAGGRACWPEYVLDEEEDYEIDSVKEVSLEGVGE